MTSQRRRSLWLGVLFLITVLFAQARAQLHLPTPVDLATLANVPQPNPTTWNTLVNDSYGYTTSYPGDWLSEDLGWVDNASLSMVTFRPPGAQAPPITVRATNRTFDEEIEIARHGLDASELTYTTFDGRRAAPLAGDAIGGGRIRVLIVEGSPYTYVFSAWLTSDVDMVSDLFDQMLASTKLFTPSRQVPPTSRFSVFLPTLTR